MTEKTIDFLRYMTFPIYERRSENSLNRLKMVPLDEDQNEEIVERRTAVIQ